MVNSVSSDFVGDLQARDLLYQITSPEAAEHLRTRSVTAYVGFDPTASSLHVGSLLPVLALARLQRAGHRPIALVGGGTGLIGDPSGKQGERSMLSPEVIDSHAAAMRAQLERFLDFDGPRGALLLNNAEWLGELGLSDFLRDIGKHFTVNQMIARDSVKPRLEDPDRSISFTEFSYMLLQAYDYLVLYDKYGCSLQMGASDQWGNIVSGCDLIRRKRGEVAHGLTIPLLTKADGSKFGKSEKGNVWLDAEQTSCYEFYQFWRNTDDSDVVSRLMHFTFLPPDEIRDLGKRVEEAPQEREGQRVLATEVTRLVHGDDALRRVERTTEVLFGDGDWRELGADALAEAFSHSPRTELASAALGTESAGLVAIVAASGLSPSRGQARKAIEQGAIRVNNIVARDVERVLGADDLIGGRFVVLRRGKKTYHVLDVRDA